jgi:hypothetical protein
VISKRTVVWFGAWVMLTGILIVPEYLARRSCEAQHRLSSSIIHHVSYQNGDSPHFDPCFVYSPTPLWKELVCLLWLVALIAWPIFLIEDIVRWLRSRRRVQIDDEEHPTLSR